MAGWLDYIKFLIADGKCETGYILGKDQGNIWACSNGLAAVIQNLFAQKILAKRGG